MPYIVKTQDIDISKITIREKDLQIRYNDHKCFLQTNPMNVVSVDEDKLVVSVNKADKQVFKLLEKTLLNLSPSLSSKYYRQKKFITLELSKNKSVKNEQKDDVGLDELEKIQVILSPSIAQTDDRISKTTFYAHSILAVDDNDNDDESDVDISVDDFVFKN